MAFCVAVLSVEALWKQTEAFEGVVFEIQFRKQKMFASGRSLGNPPIFNGAFQ